MATRRTAAHFAAESSTGSFTEGVDALVYEIDAENELMKIAYPVDLFDRNIPDDADIRTTPDNAIDERGF